MKNKGNAISEPDAMLATHIAGRVQVDIPPTYAPSLAIYHLHGGAHQENKNFLEAT